MKPASIPGSLSSIHVILTCFETTAADWFVPSKKTLARIYGKGLGVPPDLQKAKAMLKGLSKQEMKAFLDEIAGR
jgi:hypothetical protein